MLNKFLTLEDEFFRIAGDISGRFFVGAISNQCAADLSALGIGSSELAYRLAEVRVHNGFESTVPLYELLRPGSAEYEEAVRREGLAVGHSFTARGNTAAMASVNSADIWLSPFLIRAGKWAGNAALLVHETIHTLNRDDRQIQAGLWGAGSSEVGAASENITRRLQQNCFQGYSGPPQ